MRLDKFLSNNGSGSRKDCKTIIKNGWVSVNGLITFEPDLIIDEKKDVVCIEDKQIVYEQFVYLALNKPKGVVCANKDSKHKTAIDIVWEEYGYRNLSCVGRLDLDTTGLLIITDDGNFNHYCKNPKKEIFKEYKVTLLNEIKYSEYDQKLKNGIVIEDGYKCRPAFLQKIDSNVCLIKICEGKYHQVKLMFKALGNEVIELERTKIGDLDLKLLDVEQGKYIKLNITNYFKDYKIK